MTRHSCRANLPIIVAIACIFGFVFYTSGFWQRAEHTTPVFSNSGNQNAMAQPPISAPATEKRFIFYDLLEDKKATANSSSALKAPTSPDAEISFKAPAYLQVGAFTAQQDAEAQRAKLALLGIDADIHAAEVSGKGRLYRVAVGPLASMNEAAKVREQLKQAGIPYVDRR